MGKPVEALNGKIGKSANPPIAQWVVLARLQALPILPFYPHRNWRFTIFTSYRIYRFAILRNYQRSMRQSIDASINEQIQAPINVSLK